MTPRPSTQAQLDAMAARLTGVETQLADEARMRAENHAMLTGLFNGLMIPQPGQDGKSLLDRMADVTVQIESGKRTANSVIWLGKWLAAIGVVAGFFASVKLGFWYKP
ncbi:MAG: hypothetical protein ACEQSU_14890 [Microgenomates group bacterium]